MYDDLLCDDPHISLEVRDIFSLSFIVLLGILDHFIPWSWILLGAYIYP